ncbi:MAG TPA: hypothetical protein VFS04_01360 [Alphaproteobacteria bacterium]|nr:hypothetical protein [Alphaproteobacteria bacterium]
MTAALAGERDGGWRWAAGFMLLAWLVYALHWPLVGAVIPWDAKDFYYPMLRALAAARADGDSGFWTPFLYSGHDLVADPQSWLFVPGFRLLAELNGAPSMMLVDQVQLLHLLAGGCGVLLLLRRFGLAPASGLLAALVFMFGGVAASRLQHSLMTVSYAYLPWALWLLHNALRGESLRQRLWASAAFGVIGGVMALDRDQTAFLNCWLLIGAALWWLRGNWSRAALLLPAALIGAALLTLPILLTLDALAGSTRPDIGYELAAYGSQQPASLLTLLAPDMFGNLSGAYWGPGQLPWMALAPFGNDWTDETTNYLYIGALPLALLIMAVVRRGPWPQGSGLFAAGALFALLYALGAFTPAFRLFYDWLPGVSLYRRPNDAAFLLNAMLALLVGAATQRWLQIPRDLSRRRMLLAGAALTLAFSAAIWLMTRFDRWSETPLLGGLVALAVAFALLRWRQALPLLCLLAATDLIARNAAAPFNAYPAAKYPAYSAEGARLAQAIKERLGSDDAPYRAEIFGLGGDWQNAPMVYGIEQTLGYDPLRRADYVAASGAYQNNHQAVRRLGELFTGYDSPLARLLGIAVVATGRPIEDILAPDARGSLRFIGKAGDAFLYENPSALPRVMVVGRAEPDEGQALPNDPEDRVLIPGLSAPRGEAGPAGVARILSRTRDEWRIVVEMGRPGYLVLNELAHPAWQASVDGRDLPILRANRLFRAVALPTGEHTVVWRFQPFARDRLTDAARLLFVGR